MEAARAEEANVEMAEEAKGAAGAMINANEER